ncbi:hypothetical protein BDV32DRAFT_150765 [Aspergillus pseudonomiae]|uniref:Uncharacterized protein n=1 Tax=Aspergillus pseudonomiae TaxID=1506151 RepID=A0A5N6I1Y9_9EURO|nr:uncharacterized protein BDV37DRAFT_280613 [Aspergillus pseudonomiae]KAB8259053.1 hypothetical protein BDV32DRAFT_150765 [Aspergillus pseudonomiae]KAE8406652.1 hypothetical protein BDV37DRAFT_280613 [Aspergillus pseudonomiae]
MHAVDRAITNLDQIDLDRKSLAGIEADRAIGLHSELGGAGSYTHMSNRTFIRAATSTSSTELWAMLAAPLTKTTSSPSSGRTRRAIAGKHSVSAFWSGAGIGMLLGISHGPKTINLR